MVTKQLIEPKSIVVVGGSNDIHKPGGKVLKNLIDGGFTGDLFVLNPKETEVQGVKSFSTPDQMPQADLAIIAIAAKYTLPVIEALASGNSTKAFIILSAGYSEESETGKELEKQVVETVKKYNASLIGPNCVGVLTPHYQGVFTEPIPALDSQGCDFISGSGATACFIMEAGIPNGLSFANVFSVGNSAQLGVEEILEYMDETFEEGKSSPIKLLYIETINKPQKLLKHARSLISKGCQIAAVKAGSSAAGSRAASSHTGAMASPDVAVNALFKKAGIVRCFGREDLITVASIFSYTRPEGKNIAIITHAGGPAVMLTDALSSGGMEVPQITSEKSEELLEKLYPGSSVANPIDFLATGNAQQLETIIDYVDEHFDEIDAMAVIFGTPGLTEIYDVYEVLSRKIKTSKKPIYPILPSILTAKKEVEFFLDKGYVNFPDEVRFGNALCRVFGSGKIHPYPKLLEVDKHKIRSIIEESADGYLSPTSVQDILDGAGISRAKEIVIKKKDELAKSLTDIGLPVVMKVVGPIHKSDVGGVKLNVPDLEEAQQTFDEMMRIPDAVGVLLQPMLKGIELFAGVKKEDGFGHLIMCGMGGIFIEVFKDVSVGLSPLSRDEIGEMISGLKSYKIIRGTRGKEGIKEEAYADIVQRLSALVEVAPEISEIDLNPLLGNMDQVVAVDARIRIEKQASHDS